jgi:hypothetical protein
VLLLNSMKTYFPMNFWLQWEKFCVLLEKNTGGFEYRDSCWKLWLVFIKKIKLIIKKNIVLDTMFSW